MLAVCKKDNVQEEIKRRKETWENNNDITVTKRIETQERQKDGSILIKFKEEKINITRKINETAKIIKSNTAEQKLKAIQDAINLN